MEFKGTKGEWKVDHINNERKNIVSNDIDVCDLFGNLGNGFEKNERFEANAKLIAAAPELLEALQEAVIGYEWKKESWPDLWNKADDEHYEKCKKALEKALK